MNKLKVIKQLIEHINSCHFNKYKEHLIYDFQLNKTRSILLKMVINEFERIGLVKQDIFDFISWVYNEKGEFSEVKLKWFYSPEIFSEWINRKPNKGKVEDYA